MKIRIIGWAEGFLVIRMVKTLFKFGDIGLVEAKKRCDNLLSENQAFTVEIIDESLAKEFIKEIDQLNVLYQIIDNDPR